jgi:hypothetical protein
MKNLYILPQRISLILSQVSWLMSDSFMMWTCFLTKAVEEIKPAKVYHNFKEDRLRLIKDEKGKATPNPPPLTSFYKKQVLFL